MHRNNLLVIALTLSFSYIVMADEGLKERQSVEVGRPVFDLAVSRDGQFLAYGGYEGLLGIVDTESFQFREVGKGLYGSDAHILGVGFFPHEKGDVLAAGSKDGTIRFFRAHSGEKIPTGVPRELADGRGYSIVENMAVDPVGQFLAYMGENKNLYLWEPGKEKRLSRVDPWRYHLYLNEIVISQDGRYVVAAGSVCIVYQREGGLKPISRFKSWTPHATTTAIACVVEGEKLRVAIGTRKGGVSIRDIPVNVEPFDPQVKMSAEEYKRLTAGKPNFEPRAILAAEHVNAGTLHVMEAPALGKAHELHVEDLAFDSTGNYLVSTGSARVVSCSVHSFSKKYTYDVPPEKRNVNYVRLWDTRTGKMVSQFGDGGSALAAAFSSNNQLIYVGFEDGSIRAYSLSSMGVQVAALK